MRPLVAKVFVAMLLALCVVIYVLEMSGRWDRTIKDANDEAGIVAVVLCIGAGVAAARTILKHLHGFRIPGIVQFIVAAPLPVADCSILSVSSTASPPLALRI